MSKAVAFTDIKFSNGLNLNYRALAKNVLQVMNAVAELILRFEILTMIA